jgi:hypothetical protein
MRSQARAARFCNELSSGWARPIYINRHPQPPAKDTGFSGISQSLYTRVKNKVDGFMGLGYSGIMNKKQKQIIKHWRKIRNKLIFIKNQNAKK